MQESDVSEGRQLAVHDHMTSAPLKPEDRDALRRATNAVRDEVGSMLCAWIEGRRVCRVEICKPCLCGDVAAAVLGVLDEGAA